MIRSLHYVTNTLNLATIPRCINHLRKHSLQLIRQPRNNGASARRSRVLGLLENILPREAPMPPPEVAHLVQSLEVERSGYRITDREVLKAG